MLDKWIADAVGRMHVAEITGKRLAAECGYTESYLSTVLHGKKGDSATQKKIMDALARLEHEAWLSEKKTQGGKLKDD